MCDFSVVDGLLLPPHLHLSLQMHRNMLHPGAAEAPCSHLVELARAHVTANPSPSRPMMEFARVRVEDAESGCHRIFRKHGLVPSTVQIERRNLVDGVKTVKNWPIIKLSSWVKYLLDTGRLPRQMVGVDSFEKMKKVLAEFWRRYKALSPSSELFDLADEGIVCLDCCIPFYSHTDEGRSYKHLGFWVLSSHGAIGRGTSLYIGAQCHKQPLSQNEMGLSFVGGTWSTQFIFSGMLKTVYSKCPAAQDAIVKLYAEDAQRLLFNGVVSSDGLRKVHLIHIGTKGDLPALVRLGQFSRSFSHVPRGARSQKACAGICHLCLAGVENWGPDRRSIPFEDMSPQAAWVSTLHQHVAWQSLPKILEGLPLRDPERIAFFMTDLWHNFHLGVSKHFLGSAFVGIIESSLPSVVPGSVEVKFQWLTSLYISFFRSKGSTPFLTEISRESMGFPQGSTCPIGRWSKGVVSTQLMWFLDHFCQEHIVNKTHDPLLLSIEPFALLSICLRTTRCVFCFLSFGFGVY